MSFAPGFTLETALPENVSFSDNWEQFRQQITEYYNDIAVKVNTKDRGYYPEDYEIINCQRFFTAGNPQAYREVFRKVINFGTLPNAGAGNVAHGIANYANCTFTRIFATATDPGLNAIHIPHINVAAPADSVQLDVGPVNVTITTTTANYVGYTECYVVLEYVRT